MKLFSRFLIATLSSSLFPTIALAFTLNCTDAIQSTILDIDDIYHGYGDYKKSKNGSCVLNSDEGVFIIFSAKKTRSTVLIYKELVAAGAKEAVFFEDGLATPHIPDWAAVYVVSNKEIFRKILPNSFVDIESRTASKRKEIDDDLAKKAQAQAAEKKKEQDNRDAQSANELTQLRQDIAKMNAGQLFAKANELSDQGDKAKARVALSTLVSKFPDHPIAAIAAQQMATMSAASANAANVSYNGGSDSTSGNGGVSNVSAQPGGAGKCWDVLARKDKEYEAINRRPVPQGATPGLMRVMWMTEDSIKVIDANCAGDAKAANYRAELETAYKQAKTACGQLTAGGQCKANAF